MQQEYKIETTPYGEFKMRNRIPGVTNVEAEYGVPVVYIHPISSKKYKCNSIMEASEISGLYPAVITECLHNRYKKKQEYNKLFFLEYNDFTHSFENGSSTMLWYDPTSESKYDVDKHTNKIPSNANIANIWKRTNKVLKKLKYSQENINNDSPIIYVDTSGEKITYSTIKEFADEYWLHPLHIMEALTG